MSGQRLQHVTLGWLARRLAGIGVTELNMSAKDGAIAIHVVSIATGSVALRCKTIEEAFDALLSHLDNLAPAASTDGER